MCVYTLYIYIFVLYIYIIFCHTFEIYCLIAVWLPANRWTNPDKRSIPRLVHYIGHKKRLVKMPIRCHPKCTTVVTERVIGDWPKRRTLFYKTPPSPHRPISCHYVRRCSQLESALYELLAPYFRGCLRNVNYSTWRQQLISWRRWWVLCVFISLFSRYVWLLSAMFWYKALS